jgi:predicted KAP-like P-loop ATPase
VFLNDQETAVDLLYYEAVAKTVVRLIRATPGTPITIGVHGDWGAGKSSVLKMTSAALSRDPNALCLWFNGWTFEGFEDAKTVVIETIVEELRRARPGSTKVADAARKVLKRVDWLKVAKKAGGLAFTAMTGIPTFEQLQTLVEGAKTILTTPGEAVSVDDLKAFSEQAGEYLKEGGKDSDHLPHQMHKFREEFEELIKAADIEQLIVVVDDLDRCLPATAIATLEAIRLFLFVSRTAFVIGADELMIEYAVRNHFPDLPPSMGPLPYARNYLEKLIQVPFRIPALGLAETRIYVTLLQVEATLGSDHPGFQKLLDGAREELRRPWLSRGLDLTAVTKILAGSVPQEVMRAVEVSTQISTILSEGTRGNPRQIKRFLNSMALRQAIAQERGFADEITPQALAKIMLAESFAPELYAQLARLAVASNDGKIQALAQFEANASGPQSQVKKAPAKSEKAQEPVVAPEVEEWDKSDWIKGWATISPQLGGVDLRPYVFATRDKRSYLGGLAGASHLEGLVDRLTGPRLTVRGMAGEVGKLTGPEAEQVFDALQAMIHATEDLSKEPKGAQGLILLVEHHGNLQRKLLTFLSDLPTAKLGVWVASHFTNVLSDPVVAAELKKLLERWASQTENGKLKAAAAGVLKLAGGV